MDHTYIYIYIYIYIFITPLIMQRVNYLWQKTTSSINPCESPGHHASSHLADNQVWPCWRKSGVKGGDMLVPTRVTFPQTNSLHLKMMVSDRNLQTSRGLVLGKILLMATRNPKAVPTVWMVPTNRTVINGISTTNLSW